MQQAVHLGAGAEGGRGRGDETIPDKNRDKRQMRQQQRWRRRRRRWETMD